jgi:hypothetical protein
VQQIGKLREEGANLLDVDLNVWGSPFPVVIGASDVSHYLQPTDEIAKMRHASECYTHGRDRIIVQGDGCIEEFTRKRK